MMQRSHFGVVAILAMATLVLSGCGITSGGQDAATAQQQLASIEGVESARVGVSGVWAGFTRQESIIASADLAPGVEPSPEFFDYLVELAWSVNDKKPNQPLAVFVRTDPTVDVRVAAEAAGWEVPEFGFDEQGGLLFLDDVEDRFGPWPGNPPEAPIDALILPGDME